MTAWEEATYVVNKIKGMMVKGGLIDENGNAISSDPIYVGTYKGSGTQTFNCSAIEGHEKLTNKNFTIYPNTSGGGNFSGAGNPNLAGGTSVKITLVSYDDPTLTVVGSSGVSGNYSATLTIPIYCIR